MLDFIYFVFRFFFLLFFVFNFLLGFFVFCFNFNFERVQAHAEMKENTTSRALLVTDENSLQIVKCST